MATDIGDERVRTGSWLLWLGQLHIGMAHRSTVAYVTVDGSGSQNDGPTDVAGLDTTSGGLGGGGSLNNS
jgi:hypothetical protein